MNQKDVLLIENVVKRIKEYFKESILGIYLHGSAVLSDLKPRSDLDILVILEDSINQETNIKLTRDFMELSGEIDNKEMKRYLEHTIIKSRLNNKECISEYEYMYGEWLREDYKQGVFHGRAKDDDLNIVLKQAYKYNNILFGKDIQNFYSPVSDEELVTIMTSNIQELISNLESDETNVLLTLCRILYTIETQDFITKDKAAEYVKGRLERIFIRT